MVSMQSEGGHEDGPVKILFSCHCSFIGGGGGGAFTMLPRLVSNT